MHPEMFAGQPGPSDSAAQVWEESPAPALVLGTSGEILACNRAFRDLTGIPSGRQAGHLLRDGLLVAPGLERLFRAAPATLRMRIRLADGHCGEFLAALGPGPGEPAPPQTLQIVLVSAGPWTEVEGALRRELHRLEDLLAGVGRPLGQEIAAGECWQGAAQGLLEELPGPGILLDRQLRVVWPLQKTEGPPVLCSVHLLGSPGRCPECLAARALAERRLVEDQVDGCRLQARPLPGGFILEWREKIQGESGDPA